MKLDLKRELKELYTAPKNEVQWVRPTKLKYLMVDGQGDPNTAAEYREAVEALFSVAYTLKFMVKKSEQPISHTVMPLEGLWWAQDMTRFSVERKAEWMWTLMILQPSCITKPLVARARSELAKKKMLPALSKVRLENLIEGPSVQVLHVGPFSEEGPAIQKLHSAITQAGYTLAGKHHEIYLSDIRKAQPARWKTIIRQPYSA